MLQATGFNSNVTVSASGLPTGASYSFSSPVVTGGSGSTTLTIQAGTAAPGTYALTVKATPATGAPQSVLLSLTILSAAPPSPFTVTAPATISLNTAMNFTFAIGTPSGGTDINSTEVRFAQDSSQAQTPNAAVP